jgi:hypothetical protein
MPKSSSLTWPVAVHQHVAGLEVAVHQQVAVRVRHRVGQLQEQRQPLLQRQAPRRPSMGGRAPLHHEVGQAVVAAGRRPAGARCAGGSAAPAPAAPAQSGASTALAVHAALEQLDGGRPS